MSRTLWITQPGTRSQVWFVGAQTPYGAGNHLGYLPPQRVLLAREDAPPDDVDGSSTSSGESEDEDDEHINVGKRTFGAGVRTGATMLLATAQARQEFEKTPKTQQNLTAGLTAGLASDLACMLQEKGSVNGTLEENTLKNLIANGQNNMIQTKNMVRNLQNEDAKRQDVMTPAAQTRRTRYTPEPDATTVFFDESNVPEGDVLPQSVQGPSNRDPPDAQAARDELTREVAKLSAEVAEQQGTIQSLGRDLADANAARDELTREVAKLSANVAEQQGTIQSLDRDLADANAARDELTRDLAAERARCNDLAARLDTSLAPARDPRTVRDPMLKKALEVIEKGGDNNAPPDLEYKLDAANARIAMLSNMVEKYEHKVEEYEKMELSWQKEKMRERSEVELVQDKLRQDLHAANEENAKLHHEATLLKEEIADLRNNSISKHDHEKLYEKAQDYTALQRALVEAQGELKSCKKELQQANADLLQSATDSDKLKAELRTEQDTAALLEKKLAMVRAEVDPGVKETRVKKRGIFSRLTKRPNL